MAQQIKTKFIENLAITTAKINDLAVTSGKLASSIDLTGTPTAPTPSYGVSTTQIATTAFVQAALDAAVSGLKPKQAVRAASAVNVVIASALQNGSSVGGITVATGNRVLLFGQTLPAENGIYVVAASGAATRATDFDSLTPVDEINRAWVPVQEGTHAGKVYVQYGTVATVDTDAINFTFYDPIAGLVGGDMITMTGSTISVDLAAVSGLESTNPGVAGGQLRIKLEASTPTLQIDGSNQLGVKLAAGYGLAVDADGLFVNVDEDKGLYWDTGANKIGVNADNVSIGWDVNGALHIKTNGVTANELATDSVITAKIQDLAVTNAKIANGTIDLTTKVTGILPAANGGTGLSSPGASGNLLTSDGAGNWISAAPAPVYAWGKESITLDAGDITAGYVDLAEEIQADSLIASVGRLALHKTEDYTLSVVGGVTRLTLANSVASGGDEALVAGDVLFLTYQY